MFEYHGLEPGAAVVRGSISQIEMHTGTRTEWIYLLKKKNSKKNPQKHMLG